MTYLATSINESSIISEKAGAKIEDVRGKAVKYDSSGNVVLAGAGELCIGIGIMTNDETTEIGSDVDIQVKDIGLVKAGGAITKGAELAADSSGTLVTAAASQNVIAIALASASSGEYFKAMIVRYKKSAT